MIYFSRSNNLVKTVGIVAMLCGASACTGINRVQEAPFDVAQVTAMRFEFNKQTLFGVSMPEQDIAAQVTANLSEWGHPFAQGAGDAGSHVLQAEIGAVEHGSTPVGLSFSAGNSDPRALDFQKSDVLPIKCVLMPREQSQRRAELEMGFIVEDYLKYARERSDRSRLTTLLENDISTVCFNLLSELDVPTRVEEGATSQNKPTWIPEIRLEIENEAEEEKAPTSDGNLETEQQSAEQPTKSNKAKKKRIIIHNQGSPVIFKFGHERK